MKKQIILITAATALLVGCNDNTDDNGASTAGARSASPGINEPSGASTTSHPPISVNTNAAGASTNISTNNGAANP